MFGRFHKKRRMMGIAMALVGIGVLSACHSRTPEARIDHVASKVANKLDFTNEQKAILDEIANELKKDMADEKQARSSMKDDVRAWITSSELDKAQVKQAIKSKMERIDSKVDKYLDKVATLHKTLNPDQRQEVLALMDRFASKKE
ncbi:MAG: Spy/CpxP family protein refolding chaperone [Bdellovibrionaceae bacterium]|nr:Spy/CpxP family protein refolding chaperone [Pseudobdellovibrionaceae bacterium]